MSSLMPTWFRVVWIFGYDGVLSRVAVRFQLRVGPFADLSRERVNFLCFLLVQALRVVRSCVFGFLILRTSWGPPIHPSGNYCQSRIRGTANPGMKGSPSSTGSGTGLGAVLLSGTCFLQMIAECMETL